MNILKTTKQITQAILSIKNNNKEKNTIGFVPTMGALHKGHLTLIQNSKEEDVVTVVSIFVNPTQFNNKKDLKKYPRTLHSDLEKLSEILTENDIVFAPSEKEIYPDVDKRYFDFGNIDNIMEGEFRPGHFQGVAKVVSILFDIVKPDNAYFGEKDFQQLAIIRQLVKKYMHDSNINIVGCETIRETDGLAMSSRNQLLTSEHRKSAPLIYQTLSEAKTMVKTHSVADVKKYVLEKINSNPKLNVEYFEIVDNKELNVVKNWLPDFKNRACIAVFAGDIRLIDNIAL